MIMTIRERPFRGTIGMGDKRSVKVVRPWRPGAIGDGLTAQGHPDGQLAPSFAIAGARPLSGITPRISASGSLMVTANSSRPCQGPVVNAVASIGRISAVPVGDASARRTDGVVPAVMTTSLLVRG